MKFFFGFITGVIATVLVIFFLGLAMGSGSSLTSFENSTASSEQIEALCGLWTPVDGDGNDIEFNAYGAFYDYGGPYKRYVENKKYGADHRDEYEYQASEDRIRISYMYDMSYRITDGFLELYGDGKYAGKYKRAKK